MTLLVVDGNNILARSDFAAKGKQVAMSVGEVNTAALVIFINVISKWVRRTRPDRVRVCWDGGHTRRDEAFPDYKAARKQVPDLQHEALEDRTQPFAQAKEFLTWAGISHVVCPGWEADDLIAVTVRQAREKTVILSGDKDLLQLVDEDVTQIRPPDDTAWNTHTVQAAFGCLPHHLPQYLALVGDPGDGVPGLRGIGPKRALRMIEEADGDWETLLAALAPEKAAEAALMRSLVDLRYIDYPEGLWVAYGAVPAFTPVAPGMMAWGPMTDFCERYRLATVLDRLVDGSLWTDPVKPEQEGLFDGLDLPV